MPTPQVLVDTMLEMAAVTPSDLLIDLGSGDGRVVISAAQLGARAIGVELDASLLALSRRNADDAGVADRTEFIGADIFEFDFSPASVITMFLLPELTLGLRPTLFDLTPGTRIASNTWDMRGTDDDLKQRVILAQDDDEENDLDDAEDDDGEDENEEENDGDDYRPGWSPGWSD